MTRHLSALLAVLALSAPAAAEPLDTARAELSALRGMAAEVEAERRVLAVQLAQATGLNAAQAAQFERRISSLEGELRRITGRLEDLDFGIRQARQRIDRLESETKARLLRLEQGQPPVSAETPSATYTPPDGSGPTVIGSGGAATGTLPGAATATGPTAEAAAGSPGVASQPGPLQPRTLGTISDRDLAAVQREGGAGLAGSTGGQVQTPTQGQPQGQPTSLGQQQALARTPALPSDDPQAAYNSAFDLLRQMDYPAAETAFGQYLELYPDSDLAGNAKYWLGETHYVRGDYETAAVVFAEGYQDYPTSGKAPDNLLKLGMSLSNLGAAEDACATFAELQRRYPDAAPTVLQRASRESQRLGCS